MLIFKYSMVFTLGGGGILREWQNIVGFILICMYAFFVFLRQDFCKYNLKLHGEAWNLGLSVVISCKRRRIFSGLFDLLLVSFISKYAIKAMFFIIKKGGL